MKINNPKIVQGLAKVPLDLLSPIAKVWWALAQFSGNLTYGKWNYRGSEVPASIYIGAAMRHLDAFQSGEEFDPDGLHNLGAVMACCSIIIDAKENGTLIDDRPPSLSVRRVYADARRRMAHLVKLYGDRKPRHFTIADTKK